jgi:DNA polymerase-3 subunit beta
MKLRVNRQELAEAMGVVGAVAVSRTPKEILKCVLLRACPDHIELEATDLELGVRYVVDQVEVEEEGEVLVAAEKLAAIVRESADDLLQIDTDESVCHLRGADSHFQIYVQDTKEFPGGPTVSGEPDFEIGTGALRLMAERTVFASARENTRYAINGVLWEQQVKTLTLVATDGRRLSYATATLLGSRGEEQTAIVPSKAMSLFQRIFGDGDDKVGVSVTGNQITLHSSRATVSTALVEGHFPKYQEVIPSDSDKKAEFEVAELLSAVRRAALLTNEESRGVRFAFTAGELSLSSRAPQQGEAQINIPVKYQGEPLEIGFNPSFLIDVLRVVHADEVTLELKEPNRPGVLRCGPEFLYVMMPVNLS